jgi:hypothetical protein
VTDELLREELGKRLLGDRKLAGFKVQIAPPEPTTQTTTLASEHSESEETTDASESNSTDGSEQPPEK